MEIELFGRKIQFQENLKTEIAIYNIFEKYAIQFKEEYREFYFSCSGAGEVLNRSKKFAFSKYHVVCERIISILSANGVFGISETDLMNWHCIFAISTELDRLQNSIDEIGRQKQREIAYREYRKESRGRIVGGGFGVSGAIKGMTMAGAANMTTGAVHSIANAFGNMSSNSQYNRKMSELYSSGSCGELSDAIYKDVIAFYNVLEKCFEQNRIRCGNVIQKINRADVIYTQLLDEEIPKKNIEDALASLIATFPGKGNYYLLARKMSDTPSEKLIECMNYFQLDTMEFMQVEASWKWRKIVFGRYMNQLSKAEMEQSPFQTLFFSKYNKFGIIPFLASGQSLADFIEDSIDIMKMNMDRERSDEAIILANEKNGNIYEQLRYWYELPIAPYEVPLLLFKLRVTSESERENSWLLITTNKIYCCDAEKVLFYDVCAIKKIAVYLREIEINGTTFSKKNIYSDEIENDHFAEYFALLIFLLQCLHTVGIADRKIALMDDDDIYKQNVDISQFFDNGIAETMSNDTDLQEYVSSLYTNRKIFTYKTLDKIYENKLIEMVNYISGNELFLSCIEGYSGYMILTRTHLYGYSEKRENLGMELGTIDSIWYEKDSNCFVINRTIRFKIECSKGVGEEFCDCLRHIQKVVCKKNKMIMQAENTITNMLLQSYYPYKIKVVNQQAEQVVEEIIANNNFGYSVIFPTQDKKGMTPYIKESLDKLNVTSDAFVIFLGDNELSRGFIVTDKQFIYNVGNEWIKCSLNDIEEIEHMKKFLIHKLCMRIKGQTDVISIGISFVNKPGIFVEKLKELVLKLKNV